MHAAVSPYGYRPSLPASAMQSSMFYPQPTHQIVMDMQQQQQQHQQQLNPQSTHLHNLRPSLVTMTSWYDPDMQKDAAPLFPLRGSPLPPPQATTKSQSQGVISVHPSSYPLRGVNAVVGWTWPDVHETDPEVYPEDHPLTVWTNDALQWKYTNPFDGVTYEFNSMLRYDANSDKVVREFPVWNQFINREYSLSKKQADSSKWTTRSAGGKWICKPPSPIRVPSVYRHTDLCFELSPYMHSMKEFCDALRTHKVVTLTMPAAAVKTAFAQIDNVTHSSIVVNSIWVRETHSTFPEPLQVQLYSTPHTKRVGKLPWMKQAGPNMRPSSSQTPCDHVVYPDTHRYRDQLVYHAPPVTDTAEFQRWVCVNEQEMRLEMQRNQPGSHVYRIPGPVGSQIQPKTMLEFVALTEWNPRIVTAAELQGGSSIENIHSYAHIEDKKDQGVEMVVAKSILDPIIESKFTGVMDRSLYLMRVDHDLTLDIRLKDQSTDINQIIKAMALFVNPSLKDGDPSFRPEDRFCFSIKIGVKWDEWLGKD